jgi:pyruvate/2-oxoglutarate dehydrogenase complex dihydrolipoamide dehydrogenase (E3) component
LENTGVVLDRRAVRVSPAQQSDAPNIFAAGDCCGPYEVVHIAIQQGELAARNAARLLRGEPASETMDYRLKLYAVFTEPQIGVVGLSELEARENGIPYKVASYPFNDHGKSLVMGATRGFVKLLACPDSGEILGGAVVGPHASDLIHEVVVAMAFRSTVAQFAAIPHYHPTLSEIWNYPAAELAG